jgi:hypothetical protein
MEKYSIVEIKPSIQISLVIVATSSFLLLLCSSILTNIAYAQIFPNSPSSPAILQQQQQPAQPKLHVVKITSPHKGQQVPVGNDLIISGTSADNASSNCKVSVKVNFINPYHDASANGPGGQTDYSRWSFTLTPEYTTIKQGQNKIIAEFACTDNPSLLSKTSVNVTGVTSGAAADVSSSEPQTPSISTTSGSGVPSSNTSGLSSSTSMGSSQSTTGSSHQGVSSGSGKIINESKHSKILK